jgi:SnoaL-like polyketide cyclase.
MKVAASICLVALSAVVACSKSAPPAGGADSTAARNSADANVAVSKAYVDAWNKRDTVAIDSILAPGGIHDDLAEGFHGTTPAQINGFMREVLKTQPDYKWTVTSAFTDGPHVAMEWTWTSTYSGPGPTGALVKNVPASGRGVSIIDVENGKIKQFTDYYDNASFFSKNSTTK